MTQRIAVIDYGMGNLHSVVKAIEHVAGPADQVRVTDDPVNIHPEKSADHGLGLLANFVRWNP